MPRLKGSADLLEDRRKRALALLDSGESLNEVGRRIGCNASSVMRWRDARRRGGAKALRVRFSPGRPLKLDRAQRRRLVNLLLQGPMMHGYRTNLWTTARIAELIGHHAGPPDECALVSTSLVPRCNSYRGRILRLQYNLVGGERSPVLLPQT